jgi:hypothetical protein
MVEKTASRGAWAGRPDTTDAARRARMAEMLASGPAMMMGEELRHARTAPMTAALTRALPIPISRYPRGSPRR